jgi:hypothetical protein
MVLYTKDVKKMETFNEYAMEEIRKMPRSELIQHVKDYSDRLTLGEMGKQSMTKMVIQLMKIDGKDPRPLLQKNGMLELAEKSGWLS